ncbi:MAG: hypothetical protein V1736_08320 [Pseudomonadota bacterium]
MRARRNDCNPEAALHVCIPVLSVLAILAVRLSQRKDSTIVYYDTLPRYLRGLVRFLHVSQATIVAGLSELTGFQIKKVEHGDGVPGYGDLHLRMQEQVSDMLEDLIPVLEGSIWISHLAALIGTKPAISYALKQIGLKLFHELVPVAAWYANGSSGERSLVILDFYWPGSWLGIVGRKLERPELRFFVWPRWYLFMRDLFCGVLLPLRIAATTISYVLSRGFFFREVTKARYKVVTEFIDPRRMHNTAHDADYWVDGHTIQASDILFFLSREQERLLESLGYTRHEIDDLMESKGYRLVRLEEFSFPITFFKELSGVVLGLSKHLMKGNFLLGRLFLKAWSEYLDFLPLFAHCNIDNLVYLTFPNGHSGLRFNSGIVTGLCRKNNIRSIGCQTRAIHSRNYEYSFDCFDLYLAWGKNWYEMLGSGTRFIREVVIVGCIYLDTLLQEERIEKQNRSGLIACVFPSDISARHHYSLDYALSFMKNCLKLAIAHPEISFAVKSKEPAYTAILMSDERVMDLYAQTRGNLKFPDRLRHEYTDLLRSSDIIIAVGFTTPGTEGLLMGKRTVYYNELKYGGQAFRRIPGLVAKNFSEFRTLFEQALEDRGSFSNTIANDLNGLDPFRDGKALSRIKERF